ncbi:ribosome small subunit-dependent GTPase A [Psychrobacillus glaciei]|uniref:Small ribosomal subunit biogenesis GTPase RsgA n=1 Tax=Psychrobacillus glaciei TaxID=2283160 RepID=A0A5J6STC8_9BACI|nr:ribosome small subunit-dependent GTPase A [Psychrobacillus glaciei]QFG01266.1 ribosome small subunit-dependent GTPase A [Psychrobacillus glaciei]
MFGKGIVGRVLLEHKHLYRVITNEGEWLCSLSGKFKFDHDREAFPAVGDWVVMEQMPGEEKGIIQEVLPRSSQFSRKVAGQTTDIQLIAVNVDYVFLVMSLNDDFNVRRLERYLLAAWDSGAAPVVVLTKKDACDDLAYYMNEVESVAFGVDVFAVSSVTSEGIDHLATLLSAGKTGALLGSSGVGKSSLINALSGEEVMVVSDIREDDSKGRHTTTHRELSLLPGGGLLIDTPGMREFQLWDSAEGVSASFKDIEELAEGCRFRDCQHKKEPGCAIQEAISNGTLKEERYRSYIKLLRELAHIERKNNVVAKKTEANKWKQITKNNRKNYIKKK